MWRSGCRILLTLVLASVFSACSKKSSDHHFTVISTHATQIHFAGHVYYQFPIQATVMPRPFLPLVLQVVNYQPTLFKLRYHDHAWYWQHVLLGQKIVWAIDKKTGDVWQLSAWQLKQYSNIEKLTIDPKANLIVFVVPQGGGLQWQHLYTLPVRGAKPDNL